MSDRTAIDYVDATWSPVSGCTPVSAGCQHCFAARYARRRLGPFATTTQPGRFATRHPFEQVQCRDDQLEVPLHWRRPRTILVPTLGDLFHEDVPDAFRDRVFAVMALASRHRFLVLTKRPDGAQVYLRGLSRARLIESVNRTTDGGRPGPGVSSLGAIHYRAMCPRTGFDENQRPQAHLPLPNVWVGVSVEDQATADARIPILLQTPAAHRWVSVEPLLGPVDLRRVIERITTGEAPLQPLLGSTREHDVLRGEYVHGRIGYGWDRRVEFVVVGGETGPGARACQLEWIGDVVLRQTRTAKTPVWVKQLGARPEPGGTVPGLSDALLAAHERPAALEVGRG